jgi:GT2 family glycosyltransferase
MTSSPARPGVSVVIPTHRRRGPLLRALAALDRQDLPGSEFEVIVSIDGEDGGAREALGSLEPGYALRSVAGPRRGRAAACNAAVRLARGEVIVILDDDMEPAPSCLRNHARHHPPGSRVCVMGAAPVQLDGVRTPAARYVAAKFNAHLKRLAEPGHAFMLRDFYTGNASIRHDVLRKVGLFDESFTRYGNEDLELSVRLRRADVELRYDGEALAQQAYDKRLAELARDTFEKGQTAVLLARAHEEAFAELQLSTYHAPSARWRGVRAALLGAVRRRPGAVRAVIRLAELLERLGAGRRPLFYLFLLDYFYWCGVQAALAEPPLKGPLAQLAADLRDGPIRLLLHR